MSPFFHFNSIRLIFFFSASLFSSFSLFPIHLLLSHILPSDILLIMISSIFHSLCSALCPDPVHTPQGERTEGATHLKGDARRKSGNTIIPAAAPTCPGGFQDPGKSNSRCLHRVLRTSHRSSHAALFSH